MSPGCKPVASVAPLDYSKKNRFLVTFGCKTTAKSAFGVPLLQYPHFGANRYHNRPISSPAATEIKPTVYLCLWEKSTAPWVPSPATAAVQPSAIWLVRRQKLPKALRLQATS